jgi:hypothetical protein
MDLGRFFQFLNLYTVGRTPWTGVQPVARPLPTHEPTMPVFERAKTVHALDGAATVSGFLFSGDTLI